MVFELSQKLHLQIYASQSMTSLLIIHESGKSGNEEEKIQKCQHLENGKSFLDEIKNIFQFFEGLSFGEKIKIRWKIVDTSFKSLVL